ncbi:TonB system transport protein ExbD [Phaeovibrio sulfidiphilus]|uniref:Biopolymer transport protein ExbD n=1 Tax=Phaeovibrio sulfidiphilus TaxID=1220600 RepID=A0A8J6YY85_9PROT|nr:TonB system transport protein ExbD [Phaeovibrio sulfidiphilus]MBE1236728.1 TonB system transport protein ExbD [Phaeovibrio sulfidiphilus]
MAFGFRDSGQGGNAEMHEINVTPFIDVMLVLLIIFMIAAPLSTVDIKVDLPSSSASAAKPVDDKPIVISIRKDGSLALGETDVTLSDLTDRVLEETGGDRTRRLHVRADRALEYGALMDVMNVLRSSGFLKVALVGQEGAGGQRGGAPGP